MFHSLISEKKNKYELIYVSNWKKKLIYFTNDDKPPGLESGENGRFEDGTGVGAGVDWVGSTKPLKVARIRYLSIVKQTHK